MKAVQETIAREQEAARIAAEERAKAEAAAKAEQEALAKAQAEIAEKKSKRKLVNQLNQLLIIIRR